MSKLAPWAWFTALSFSSFLPVHNHLTCSLRIVMNSSIRHVHNGDNQWAPEHMDLNFNLPAMAIRSSETSGFCARYFTTREPVNPLAPKTRRSYSILPCMVRRKCHVLSNLSFFLPKFKTERWQLCKTNSLGLQSASPGLLFRISIQLYTL